MQDYEPMVRECYAPIIEKYKFQFAKFADEQFFLIGNGFALWVFADKREAYGDIGYVSVDKKGVIRAYSLMDINENRFTPQDRECYGDPTTADGRIESDFKVDCTGLMNRCNDILSGDKQWLEGYEDEGTKNYNISEFLRPYFEEQGLSISG